MAESSCRLCHALGSYKQRRALSSIDLRFGQLVVGMARIVGRSVRRCSRNFLAAIRDSARLARRSEPESAAAALVDFWSCRMAQDTDMVRSASRKRSS